MQVTGGESDPCGARREWKIMPRNQDLPSQIRWWAPGGAPRGIRGPSGQFSHRLFSPGAFEFLSPIKKPAPQNLAKRAFKFSTSLADQIRALSRRIEIHVVENIQLRRVHINLRSGLPRILLFFLVQFPLRALLFLHLAFFHALHLFLPFQKGSCQSCSSQEFTGPRTTAPLSRTLQLTPIPEIPSDYGT